MELFASHTLRFKACFALAAMLVVGLPATSFAFVVTAEQRAACAPDVYRLCSSAIPDVAKIIACMRKEKPNLSAACHAVVDAAEQQLASRSIMTEENAWCQFSRLAAVPGQQDWLNWCGPAAHVQ